MRNLCVCLLFLLLAGMPSGVFIATAAEKDRDRDRERDRGRKPWVRGCGLRCSCYSLEPTLLRTTLDICLACLWHFSPNPTFACLLTDRFVVTKLPSASPLVKDVGPCANDWIRSLLVCFGLARGFPRSVRGGRGGGCARLGKRSLVSPPPCLYCSVAAARPSCVVMPGRGAPVCGGPARPASIQSADDLSLSVWIRVSETRERARAEPVLLDHLSLEIVLVWDRW